MDDIKVVTRSGTPESFGWLRRKEFDSSTGICFEQPDGGLLLFPRYGPKPTLVRYDLHLHGKPND